MLFWYSYLKDVMDILVPIRLWSLVSVLDFTDRKFQTKIRRALLMKRLIVSDH